MKQWSLLPPVPEHLLLAYPEHIRKMLFFRGITDEAQAEIFLHPDYERDFLDPFLFKDMEKAVVRIFEAIEAKEKIVVYSDYDCDGIPAATILSDLFKKIGYDNVQFYIPDRHDEGYGLHHDAVVECIKNGATLLITLDLGITAVAEVAHAQANGLDVIITDHHLSHSETPRAFAIINPHMPDAGYPEAVLCGAGVSFKLAQGFIQKYGDYFSIPKGWEKWLLDMAALGTLSDMVPLSGENRAITYFGMTVIRKNRRLGLKALFSALKISTETLVEDDLTFMVAPRINAASRMDSPMRAFELLSADTIEKAVLHASHLSKINDDRKLLVARIMKEVRHSIQKRETGSVLVVGNTGWRAGILGLVAGKLTDEFGIPSFVWGMEEGDDNVKGSCRSDGSVNVVELMTVASDHLVSFGGHSGAGGFVATKERIHFLEGALSLAYTQVKTEKEIKKEVALAVLPLKEVNRGAIKQIGECAPFGLGNPKPVFLFQNVVVKKVKLFGKEGEHLELTLEDESGSSLAVAFFKKPSDYVKVPEEGGIITLAGVLEMSYFAGRTTTRIRIIDIF